MTAAELLKIVVYPEKGAPGRSLPHATLTDSGLVGNRAKKHALLVASADDVATTMDHGEELRANLVVAMPAADLAAAAGRELRIGEVVVRVDRAPSGCAGMYAEVVTSGDLVVGDDCELI